MNATNGSERLFGVCHAKHADTYLACRSVKWVIYRKIELNWFYSYINATLLSVEDKRG